LKKYLPRLCLGAPLLAVWLWGKAAVAVTVDVTLEAEVAGSSDSSVNITLFQVDSVLAGVTTGGGSTLLDRDGFLEWTVSVDPDPLIQAVFTVSNSSTNTRTFDLTFGLPTALVGPVLKRGSLSADFADAGSDGVAGLEILGWDGLVDASPVLSLLSGSFACSGGPGCSGSIAPVSEGPLFDVASVSNAIGINLVFSLSGGDTATFDTVFEVVPAPVPVPAAVWLFGSGLIGLAGILRPAAAQSAPRVSRQRAWH